MNKKIKLVLTFFLTIVLLTGCGLTTVESMYCLPRRSQGQRKLQSAINESMIGLEYCAPRSGENQQTVQTADLDGDGKMEYLLFACRSNDKALQILIFKESGDDYVLSETIEGVGSAFDQVEYVEVDGRPGCDLIVGLQLNDQVIRSVSVYTFYSGQAEQLLMTNYTRFLTFDLDQDRNSELVILHSGIGADGNGVAQYYGFHNGIMERSPEAEMSEPIKNMKRIMASRLADGTPAVYVASAVNETSIVTDVFAVTDTGFQNVAQNNKSGTGVATLRNYYVYADDIDGDGIMELPDLINMHSQLSEDRKLEQQYLIRWYSMEPNGNEQDKMYTYHNFDGGWFIEIGKSFIPSLVISQENGIYSFYMVDQTGIKQRLLTVYAFSSHDREEKAASDHRFILYRTEPVLYAGELGSYAAEIGVTKEDIAARFHLIHHDWKTGET